MEYGDWIKTISADRKSVYFYCGDMIKDLRLPILVTSYLPTIKKCTYNFLYLCCCCETLKWATFVLRLHFCKTALSRKSHNIEFLILKLCICDRKKKLHLNVRSNAVILIVITWRMMTSVIGVIVKNRAGWLMACFWK